MQKQNKAKRIISLILLLAMIITMLSVTTVSAFAAEDGVAGFVQRCYQVTLNREPDETGYADWTGKLTNGEMDGATVAWGFVFSDEYSNANKDNGAFVTDMYTLFLGRTPDEEGYNDWVGKMEAGADRQEIFYGFANSVEFFNICTDYGVTAGYFTTEYNKDQVNAVNMFVARMYRICFGRLGDQGGQADWTSKLLRGELTGIDCAAGFINSNEYQNLNLSNEDYIRNMYRTFLGREADEEGFNGWVSQLEEGHTRDEIFAGFANSAEFQSICDGYGIVRGDYTAQDVKQARWRLKKEYNEGNYGSYKSYEYFPGTSILKKKTFHSSNADNFDEVWEYDREGRMIYAKYYDAGGPGHQGVYEGHAEDITDSNYCFVENHSRPGCEDTEVVTTKYARFNGGNWIKLPQRGSYEVDEKGNLIWESDGYLPETVRTYKYDEKNRIVEETHSYGTAENGFSDTYTYTYEENGTNGLVSKMIRNISSHSNYIDQAETNYTYSDIYEYEYDEHGNMVREIFDNKYTVIYEYEEY